MAPSVSQALMSDTRNAFKRAVLARSSRAHPGECRDTWAPRGLRRDLARSDSGLSHETAAQGDVPE
jgi:hypothetical protein